MPVYADPAGGVTLRAADLQSTTATVVERLGTPPDIAADVATVLVASDRRGIASHGTARLARYAFDIEQGTMDPTRTPGAPARAAGAVPLRRTQRLGSPRRPPGPPVRMTTGVLIPGEPEAAGERRSDEHGVSLDPRHLASLQELADRYGVPLPETTPI